MNYEATHVSLADESTAMIVSEDRYFITLVNEDGYEWTDPADKWEPIDYRDDIYTSGEQYMADMYNSDSYINYLNGY